MALCNWLRHNEVIWQLILETMISVETSVPWRHGILVSQIVLYKKNVWSEKVTYISHRSDSNGSTSSRIEALTLSRALKKRKHALCKELDGWEACKSNNVQGSKMKPFYLEAGISHQLIYELSWRRETRHCKQLGWWVW